MAIDRRSFVFAAAALVAACERARQPRAQALTVGATVLALGDSLTFGSGAVAEASYPAVLSRLTGWNVVNGGVPGDTSAQALARLPALLDAHAPQLVVVSVGGNDFLRRLPEAETRSNVQRICELAIAAHAQVMLVAVPRASLAAAATGLLTDHPLYAEIASALAVPLQREGWAEVLGDPDLRSDTIHANARGYDQFARRLVATARAVGLLAR
jgi:acyl-CoA hydrolase